MDLDRCIYSERSNPTKSIHTFLSLINCRFFFILSDTNVVFCLKLNNTLVVVKLDFYVAGQSYL